MVNAPSTRRGKIIGIVLCGALLLGFLLVGGGLYVSGKWITDWRVQRVSQPAPVAIVSHDLSNEELQLLDRRVDQFITQGSEAGRSSSLELRADELTALIAAALPIDNLSKIHFETEDKNLFIRGSIPLSSWGYEGSYLNGRLWVSIDKVGGRFRIRLVDIMGQEKGWISGKSLRALGLENITKYAYQHPQLSTILHRADRIEVHDQLIQFFPKTG